MALGDVIDAVKTRWDAKALGSTISGGIHRARGENATLPCVIYSTIASPVTERAARSSGRGTRYETTQFQLLYIGKAGPAAARTHITAIKAAFDWAPLNLDSGTLVYCKFVSEIDMDDPEQPGNPNGILWALTYDVMTAEATNLSPS